jgi:translation initiation factor 2B subunit (eIF-2B alpha/beta/delta family)
MKPDQIEKNILNNNRSGSSEVFETTIKYILDYLKEGQPSEKKISHILDFSRKISDKFSSMMLIVNGLRQIRDILSGYDKNKHNDVILVIEKMLAEFYEIDKKIIENCYEIFEKKVSVVTYSQSGLVKKVLKHYRSKLKSVCVSESRPAMEGQATAKFFTGLDIPVRFCVDMHLPELMNGADYFIIGADCVAPDFFINKIGTANLLQMAQKQELRTYVLFESLKIVKRNALLPEIQRLDPGEIYDNSSCDKIEVINRYFEVVPNYLVHEFISDQSIISPTTLKILIKKPGGRVPPGHR